MADPLLVIENLHKKFDDNMVLRGVDLTMNATDVVSIIGSSGSGKTTLLRCVNLLEEFHDARNRLLDMARAARRVAIPDAANRVAQHCLEVAPG